MGLTAMKLVDTVVRSISVPKAMEYAYMGVTLGIKVQCAKHVCICASYAVNQNKLACNDFLQALSSQRVLAAISNHMSKDNRRLNYENYSPLTS